MSRPCFFGGDWEMGHTHSVPGVRYGLKNGQEQYLCVAICDRVGRISSSPTVRVTPHALCAAKFHSVSWLVDQLDFYRTLDDTFRIVPLLDHHWN